MCVTMSITRYEKESTKVGKASFAFAWVLDETGEERNRFGLCTKIKSHTVMDLTMSPYGCNKPIHFIHTASFVDSSRT